MNVSYETWKEELRNYHHRDRAQMDNEHPDVTFRRASHFQMDRGS